jgi:hypothetical protein
MENVSLGNGSFGVANAIIPKEGPKTIAAKLDFSNAAEIAIDGSQVVQMGKISFIQGVYIDNASNAVPFTLNIETTGQRVICPPNHQGYFPILAPLPPKMLATMAQLGGRIVNLQFYNVPMQACIWSAI